MMKIKWIIALVFLPLIIGLSGCNEINLEENSESPFIGSWGAEEDYQAFVYTFYSDKTFKADNLEGEVIYGDWDVSENKLVLIIMEQTVEFYYSFYANNDVLELESVQDGRIIRFSRDYIPDIPPPEPTTLSMNVYSRNDANQQVIWLVSGVEGDGILYSSCKLELIKSNENIDTGASFLFNDVNSDNNLNAGDTISITASSDGYYSLEITHKTYGYTIFQSTSTKY